MAQPRFGIDIVANDKTKAGVISAQKALARLPKAANDAGRAVDRANAAAGRFNRGGLGGMVRTFSAVERASSRAFGGSSIISQAAGRLGAIGEVASAVGTGFGEASAAGGILAGTIGAVGVVATATVAVLAGVAVGAYKLADGWAANVAGLGRLSQTIGIASRDLQKFQQAGERAGVSSESVTGSIAGLAQAANDARYGRNQAAAQAMAFAGIKPKLGADGNIDNRQLALDAADAIARQKNPQSQAQLASYLGISREALPFFRQGSKAISGDLADVDKNGVVNSDAEVANAGRFVRDKAILGQRIGRKTNGIGSAAASAGLGAMEGIIGAARDPGGAVSSFKSVVVDTFKPVVEKLGRVADRLATIFGAGAIAGAVATQRKHGVPAAVTLAQAALESGNGKHMPAGSNNPFGIKARAGEPYVTAMTSEFVNGRMIRVAQRFRKFDSMADAMEAHGRLLANGRAYAEARKHTDNADDYADALTGHYATDPNYGSKLKKIMHSHTHTFEGLPAGVTVKTKTAGSGDVTIGRALDH